MSRKDHPLPDDRRNNQVKGDIDISDMNSDELSKLRDEDLTNVDTNELPMLEAETGVTRGTEEATGILPDAALHRDLEAEEDPGPKVK